MAEGADTFNYLIEALIDGFGANLRKST